MTAGDTPVSELIGVYHADGSILGELRYFVGAHLGRTHCALCDITHALVREKPEWRQERATLPVPFRTVHLDERDADVEAASGTVTPVVLARTPGGLVRLLEPEDLDRCGGRPAALLEALRAAAAERGLAV